MIYVLKINGKLLRLDTDGDECLYESTRDLDVDVGEDLYRHVAKSGKVYYYLLCWCRGESDKIKIISEAEARDFIISKANEGFTEGEVKRFEEIFPGIFEETA